MTGLLLRDMNLSNPSVNPFVLLALKKKKFCLCLPVRCTETLHRAGMGTSVSLLAQKHIYI